MSITLSRLLAVVLLLLSPVLESKAQPSASGLTTELQAALHYYLGKDCAVEDEPKALDRLVNLSGSQTNVLVPVLGRALNNGPDSAELADIQQSLENEWLRRKEAIDRGAVKGLSEKHLRYLTDITKKEIYVQARLDTYKFQVRQRSLIALNRIDAREAQIAIANARKSGSQEVRAVILATDLSTPPGAVPAFGAPPARAKPPIKESLKEAK